jgi:hypothetical protein
VDCRREPGDERRRYECETKARMNGLPGQSKERSRAASRLDHRLIQPQPVVDDRGPAEGAYFLIVGL